MALSWKKSNSRDSWLILPQSLHALDKAIARPQISISSKRANRSLTMPDHIGLGNLKSGKLVHKEKNSGSALNPGDDAARLSTESGSSMPVKVN